MAGPLGRGGALNVLALEPYHGGSHRAFLDGWVARSRHRWTVLGLPAYKWKWRMRHAAITLAAQAAERGAAGGRWDRLFCSDMLGLAEFRGLAPPDVARLPAVVYFHENQLTYPVAYERERDHHFAFTNFTTALAADAVWFNSADHRDAFLAALVALLKKMPDYPPLEAVETVRRKSRVRYPGIAPPPGRGARRPGPLRLLWSARWEQDKDPETLFAALELLAARGVTFRISVLGERFKKVPAVFARARETFRDRIDRWGHVDDPGEYAAALGEADVIVSTALQETFGLSVVEAVAAGAYPLLPRRLCYPELLDDPAIQTPDDFLYDGSAAGLADRLATLATRLETGNLWGGDPERGVRAMARFHWDRLAPGLDAALEALTRPEEARR